MPRYKAKCFCGSEWFVRKAVKLDDEQKYQLRHQSLCAECASIWRRWYQSVQTGVAVLSEQEQAQMDKMVGLLRENKPYGFNQRPIRETFAKHYADDRRAVAEGIKTRYRGFSPTRELLTIKFRLLMRELTLKEAAI